MKAKISFMGEFFVYRGDGYKKQFCPFTAENDAYCGDWCPQFGEPVEKRKVNKGKTVKKYWELEICFGKKLVLEELIDERK